MGIEVSSVSSRKTLPPFGRDQTDQHIEGRGLPRPVGPQQRDDFALAHPDVHLRDDPSLLVDLGEAASEERRMRGRIDPGTGDRNGLFARGERRDAIGCRGDGGVRVHPGLPAWRLEWVSVVARRGCIAVRSRQALRRRAGGSGRVWSRGAGRGAGWRDGVGRGDGRIGRGDGRVRGGCGRVRGGRLAIGAHRLEMISHGPSGHLHLHNLPPLQKDRDLIAAHIV